jgi:hypothetical protein
MAYLSLILSLAAAEPDDGLAKQMLPIYVKEASEYSIAVESAPRKSWNSRKSQCSSGPTQFVKGYSKV